MNTREAAMVAVVVLSGVAGVALPTVAVTTADLATQANGTNATATEANVTANESAAFGSQLTAFMQSSASEANDTVESGMWTAAFERANESEKARMAHGRADALEQRLERLRERNRTLAERYENGSISRSAYVAQSSALSGRIAALRTSIDDADRAAKRAGVNETGLDRLRDDARNVTGPETAGVARGVVAGGQGPPADRVPGSNAEDGAGVDAGTDAGGIGGENGANPGNANNASGSDGGAGAGPNGSDSGGASSGNDDSPRGGSDNADSDGGSSGGADSRDGGSRGGDSPEKEIALTALTKPTHVIGSGL